LKRIDIKLYNKMLKETENYGKKGGINMVDKE
jgi:hypothetical protein